MTVRGLVMLGVLALALLAVTPAARAYDPNETFMQGSIVVSPEFAYGHQFDLEHKTPYSNLEFVNTGVRFGWLPFAPSGPGPLRGSFEIGLEPVYQRYLEPRDAFFAGLGLTFRYHFLSLGRVVPWVDLFAAAGGTDLDVKEIRSDFAVLLQGGVGVSIFVTDRAALYGGYRFLHVSNGNTERPNRGFEAHTGVFGISYFFP